MKLNEEQQEIIRVITNGGDPTPAEVSLRFSSLQLAIQSVGDSGANIYTLANQYFAYAQNGTVPTEKK